MSHLTLCSSGILIFKNITKNIFYWGYKLYFFLFSKDFKNLNCFYLGNCKLLESQNKNNWGKFSLMLYFKLITFNWETGMDYKKKSLKSLNRNECYEEIDTRLASGWYVDVTTGNKKKKYKTKEVVFKVSKKSS